MDDIKVLIRFNIILPILPVQASEMRCIILNLGVCKPSSLPTILYEPGHDLLHSAMKEFR